MSTDAIPYSAAELTTIKRFQSVCEAIMACRFVREFDKQEHTFTVRKLPDGTFENIYPVYDEDDFLAFLTHYRKLVANKESTNVFKILKVISRYASSDERQQLKEIRKLLVAEAKHPPMQMAIGPPGQETTFTPEAIQNLIFNGKVFHAAEELQGDLRQILEFDPLTTMTFLRYATTVVNNCWHLSCVLTNRGYC